MKVNNYNEVIYANYDNEIEIAVNCISKVRLSGMGVSLTSIGDNKYIARVIGEATTVSFNITGTTTANKTVNLGKLTFKVLPFPEPMLYLDNNDHKSMVSRTGEHVLEVKSAANLFKTMKISTWEIVTENGATFSGNGNRLTAEANSAILAAPARSSIEIAVSYADSNKEGEDIKKTRATYYVE